MRQRQRAQALAAKRADVIAKIARRELRRWWRQGSHRWRELLGRGRLCWM
jgi:hypothetical protein